VAQNLNIYEEIKRILQMQTGRYTKFLMEFSVGFAPTELEFYKWILYPLITLDEKYFENGLAAQAMRRMISERHPIRKQVSILKLIGALDRAVALQQEKNIRPIVIEFDKNRSRLKIVDKGFLLWRAFQEERYLLELADLDAELNVSEA
jgi:hypothetical protein